MVTVDSNGKEAILEYCVVDYEKGFSLLDINLKTGRPHQIRVQFSSRNNPLYGDQRYNKKAKVGEQIALHSYFLSFHHPVTKKEMVFELPLPNRYPFTLF